MYFKQNLLKKIEIKKMAQIVRRSIGPPDSDRKIDKQTMGRLLAESPYTHQKVRDLDLYIRTDDKGPKRILVLDNELPIYSTSVEDVVVRKSPLIKEMVSIRNIIKILNDKDVVISKKEDSVDIIQMECIAGLDLAFTRTDIEGLAQDGIASLKRDYSDGVLEALSLFVELISFHPPPQAFKISKCDIWGALGKGSQDETLYGPLVIYSLIHNSLKLIRERLDGFNRQQMAYFHDIVKGDADAAIEGPAVFDFLKNTALQKIEDPSPNTGAE